MQLLSTLAFFAIAAQCVLAAPERKLLRSGYDSPVDFSKLTGGATDSAYQQHNTGTTTSSGLPDISSITKVLPGVTGSKDGLSNLLPSGLPSTDALSSLTKGGGVVPTDALSSLTSGGGLDSITSGVTSGVTKGAGVGSVTKELTGKLPSLPGLPIGGGDGNSKGLSGITDSVSRFTGGLGLPSTSTATATATSSGTGKRSY